MVLSMHACLSVPAGAYPETVAINLWGLDAIKTKVRCGVASAKGRLWPGVAVVIVGL